MITLTSAYPGDEERQQVIDLVRRTLADGRCVCVEPCPLQGSYGWKLDVLSRLKGHPEAAVEWHGRNFTLTFLILLNNLSTQMPEPAETTVVRKIPLPEGTPRLEPSQISSRSRSSPKNASTYWTFPYYRENDLGLLSKYWLSICPNPF